MAATVTKVAQAVPGASVQIVSTVALDGSYPNPAGYVFTPASFGLNIIRKIANIEPVTLSAAATWVYWVAATTDGQGNITSFAVHLAVVSTGVEVANGISVSTASYNFVVEGN